MASIVIQPGDTLSAIAAANGTTVAAILALNPAITNPDLIFPGATITLPSAPAPVSTAPAPAPVTIPAVVEPPPGSPNLTPGPTVSSLGLSEANAAAVVDHFIALGRISPLARASLIQLGVANYATMNEFLEFLDQTIATEAPTGTTPSDGTKSDITTLPAGVSPAGVGGAVVRIDFMTSEGLASVPVFFPDAVWQALLASPLAGLYGLDRPEPVIPVGQLANFKRDVGSTLSGGLLDVFNTKIEGLSEAGAPGSANIPPVSPEMANSGIAWAIDPISGRPELIDTKPFFGPPISSFQFIPTDPNDPGGGGTWNVIIDPTDIKNIFEGVPSSVRPWLQLALDAGGDTGVVPDGAARAWVSFILAQVNGSSRRPPTELPFGVGLPEFEGGRPGASIVEPDQSIFPITGGVAPVILPIPDGVDTDVTIPPAATGGVDTGGAVDTGAGGDVTAPPTTTPIVLPTNVQGAPAGTAPIGLPEIVGGEALSAPTPTGGVEIPSQLTVALEPIPSVDTGIPSPALLPPLVTPTVTPAPTPVVAPVLPPADTDIPSPALLPPPTISPTPIAPTPTTAPITTQQIVDNEINALQILIDAGAPPIVIAAQQKQVDDLLGFSSINVT